MFHRNSNFSEPDLVATLPIDRNDGPTHGISESVQQDPSRDDGSDSVGAASLPTPKPSAEGFHLERSASNNTRINAESSSSNSSSISDDESNESTPLNDPSDRNACSNYNYSTNRN